MEISDKTIQNQWINQFVLYILSAKTNKIKATTANKISLWTDGINHETGTIKMKQQ